MKTRLYQHDKNESIRGKNWNNMSRDEQKDVCVVDGSYWEVAGEGPSGSAVFGLGCCLLTARELWRVSC